MLDRLRILEAEIAKFGKCPPALSSAEARPSGAAKEEKPSPASAPKIPETVPLAAPEELLRIKDDWKRIVTQIPDRLQKNIFENAVPLYDSVTAENKLFIELSDTVGELYIVNDDAKNSLMRIIEKMYGRHVDIELHMARDRKASLTPIGDVREGLKKIHMQVEETKEDG